MDLNNYNLLSRDWLVIWIILGLFFTLSVLPGVLFGSEQIDWSTAADWQAAVELEHLEIDGNNLKWNLQEIVTIRETSCADWADNFSEEADLTCQNEELIIDLGTAEMEDFSATFTTAGVSGRTGPTQAQVNSAYSGTELDGQVTVIGNGIQQWTVPFDGSYRITASGGQGANATYQANAGQGGRGASIAGDFHFQAGEVLKILVGQQATTNVSVRCTSAGGGTFVTYEDNSPIIVAGGGGGANYLNNGQGGRTDNWGTSGGTGAASGAGLIGNGNTDSWVSPGAQSFVNGGLGTTGNYGQQSGFGGGGSTHGFCGTSYTGGGGYSGGRGSNPANGGGSYNSGENVENTAAVNTGNGTVEIEFLDPEIHRQRISRPISLVDVVGTDSLIDWNQTVPAGTDIIIETAITEDGIDTPTVWETATAGEPVPGIQSGENMSGKYLWIRQSLVTADETVTPRLSSLTVELNKQSLEGNLLTETKTMVAGKPELRSLEYNLNGQQIVMEIIGSPGTPAEERIENIQLTGQLQQELPWIEAHTEFQLGVKLQSLDGQTSPEFGGVTLLRPAEFALELDLETSLFAAVPGVDLVIGGIVTNINNVEYSQDLELEIGGLLYDSHPVTLAGGETQQVHFYHPPLSSTDPLSFQLSTNNQMHSGMLRLVSAPQFEITIDQAASQLSVIEAEDIVAQTEITSLESFDYGQIIEIYLDGQLVDSDLLKLPVGETVVTQFVVPESSPAMNGKQLQVGWDGNYASHPVEVFTWPNFSVEIRSIVNQDGSDTVDQGDTAVIVVTVENTGDLPGTQEINFLVEGTHQGSHQLTLDGHTEQTVEFDYLTARKDDGAVLWVESEDSYDSWPLRVYLDPKFIVQIDQSSSLLRVVKQQEVQVIAGIDNTGDYPDLQTIELVVDQQVVATAQVGLPGRSGTVVELSYLTAREDDGINLLVRSFDTSDSVNIDVLDFAGGAGSLVEPYLVNNWYQLDQLRREPAAKYKLMQSLDQTSPGYDGLAGSTANGGLGWKPVGTAVTPFTGGFDGRGESLSGLRVERPGSGAAGLFGFVGESGEITSLELLDAEVSGSNNVGLLVGQISEGTITDCRVDGTVMGDGIYSGGLVGRVIGGQLERLQADVELVSSGLYAGGLAGGNSGRIVNSTARGTVSGEFRTGGFVGENLSGGELVDLYSTVDVRGEGFQTGGLVAYNAGLIRRAYASGEVKGARVKGGLVGHSPVGGGVVEDSFWDSQQTLQAASVGGTARTPGGMRDIETYRAAGWNIEETDQLKNAAYPFLAAEVTGNSPVWYITGAAYHDWSVGEQILDDLDDPDTAPVLITERVYSYPNPYRGDLGGPVSFYLPQDYGDLVQLDLFNLQGRRIVRESLVVDSDRLASWWPSVASGSYIYRVSGGGRSSSNTLTIIR